MKTAFLAFVGTTLIKFWIREIEVIVVILVKLLLLQMKRVL